MNVPQLIPFTGCFLLWIEENMLPTFLECLMIKINTYFY